MKLENYIEEKFKDHKKYELMIENSKKYESLFREY